MSTRTPARRTPLSASADVTANGSMAASSEGEVVHVPRGADEESTSRRQQRFADGIRSLRTGGGTLRFGERALMIIGGIIAPVGIIVVLLGWWGASQTPFVFEQVPYLISGGLFGLALVFLGAFFYFAHWMTELVREHRSQSSAIVEALGRLQDEVSRLAGAVSAPAAASLSTGSDGRAEGHRFVSTERGTMAHRPDCVVVAGKTGLREVTLSEGVSLCKLCMHPQPLGT